MHMIVHLIEMKKTQWLRMKDQGFESNPEEEHFGFIVNIGT